MPIVVIPIKTSINTSGTQSSMGFLGYTLRWQVKIQK